MTVQATDLGFPAQNSSNTARVTVRIVRNQRTPDFKDIPSNLAIEETVDVGDEIMDLSATDSDPEVRELQQSSSLLGYPGQLLCRWGRGCIIHV